jgi:predicted nucleotidyltransferase
VDDFAAVLTALTEGGVEFVVVGGIAVVAHGYVRATRDIDAVIAPSADNIRRARQVVSDLDATRQDGTPLVERDLAVGRPWILRTKYAYLDLLPDHDVPFALLRDRASVRRVDGVEVPICSLDHLVALKRAAGRTKDVLDLEMLREALGDLPG